MHNHKNKSKIKFLGLVIVLGLIWYLSRYLNLDTKAIEDALGEFPVLYSSIIYVVLYVIVTFFVFFSKDVFWLVGAIVFGPYVSALLVWISEIINAFVLFNLARKMGRGFIESRLDKKYHHLDEKLGGLSFFWLFVFRAAPLIPYRFMDLGAGLTKITFRRYLMAVIFASPFKIFWIQYVLAGVGASIFSSPSMLVEYFMKDKVLFLVSLVYPLLVVLVVWKLIPRD